MPAGAVWRSGGLPKCFVPVHAAMARCQQCLEETCRHCLEARWGWQEHTINLHKHEQDAGN